MTVWFTADLHFGHARIIELSHRPFGSIEEHDQALMDRWSACVRPDDIVWVLGDLAIEGKWKHGLEAIQSLPGRKRLITGNHDQAWVGKSDWTRFIADYQDVFGVVTPWARTKVLGTKVNLSHFPYVGDHTEGSRFDEYRLRIGKPLIHGHVHSTERLTTVPINDWVHAARVPQIHVGVDAWDFRPVSDREVADLIRP